MIDQLILITGMPGAGKTTLASYFIEKGFTAISMGDVIRDLAAERGVKPSPAVLGALAKEIRAEGGDAAVAERCVDKLKTMDFEKVLIDGIRSIAEVDKFKDQFNANLVAVYASVETRYYRLKSRRRSDDPLDRESFKVRDMRELGFSMGHAIAMSDYMIVNEGSLEEFKAEFNQLAAWLGLYE
jgi:dephospho-CoA kinase